MGDTTLEETDCDTCAEDVTADCPKSQRECGHHCNHSWSHDHCHWCGATFGEVE